MPGAEEQVADPRPPKSRPMVLNQEKFYPQREIWQSLEAFLVVITTGVLLASSG